MRIDKSDHYTVLHFSEHCYLEEGDIIVGVLECSDGKVEIVVVRPVKRVPLSHV